MKTLAYTCPFVPAEWIAAHGIRPSRITPRSSGASAFAGPSEGVCQYASAFIHTVCSEAAVDAVVLTTACDQMRRASEMIERRSNLPLFLMNVPSTWQTVAAQELYMSELRRLGRFLARQGGRAPSRDKLAEAMDEYDRARSNLRAGRGHVPPRRYSEAIAKFARDGMVDLQPSAGPWVPRRVPVALVGGPLMLHHFQIFELVESDGGDIVLDATGTGERTLPRPFDRRLLSDNPFLCLADAYFGSIPDAFRRPNSQLYMWLKQEISARGVRGIIFHYYAWCDIWHGEMRRMKEWSEVPLLAVVATSDEDIDGHTATRIESFLEMLK